MHDWESNDRELWDAGEGVCCAAFQLGACNHTETFDPDDYDFEEN